MTKEVEYPEKTFRIGRITCALWKREVEIEGRSRTRFSAKLQKSYKDPKSGEWQSYDMYLSPVELPVLEALIRKAYDHSMVQEDTDNKP